MGQVIVSRNFPFSADQVWAKLTDFENIQDWHRSLSTTQVEGPRGVGLKRRVTMYDGHEMYEEVTQFDPTRRTISLMRPSASGSRRFRHSGCRRRNRRTG